VTIAKGLERAYPVTNRDQRVALMTELQARIARDPPDSELVAMLMALAAVVLLLACANLASLVLSRARARTREMAIRLAVGAGRMRLVRQLMAESLVVALGGGAVSLLFADAGAAFLSRIRIPTDLPLVLSFHQTGSARAAVRPGCVVVERHVVRTGACHASQPYRLGVGLEVRRRR
jgi:predicted lysophospholipase L1 biosynthesis ABC-type transport system permease subunit